VFSGKLAAYCTVSTGTDVGMYLYIPAMIGFLLLVLHSVITRGWRDTLWFMAPVLLYGFLHEKSVSSPTDPAEYLLSRRLGPYFGGVPIIIPVGWTFAFYLGLCVAEKLTQTYSRFRGNLYALLGILMWVVFFISMSVETVGSRANWWNWQYNALHEDVWWIFCTPKFVLMNWALTALTCSMPFFLMRKSRFRKRKTRYLFMLIYTFPFVGRIIGIFNITVSLILFAFMFVLPFVARFDLEPADS